MASVAVATHDDYEQRFLGPMSSSNRTPKPRRGSQRMVAVEKGFTATKAAVPYFDAASDDSSSLNRKSMSLNVNPGREMRKSDSLPRNPLGGPQLSSVTVLTADSRITVSDMTRVERAALRRKLRRDLERLRTLSCKLEARVFQIRSQSLSVGANPSCSDAQFSGNDARSCPGREVTSHRSAPSHRDAGMAFQHGPAVFEGGFTGGDSSLKEKRTPKVNQLYHSSEFLMSKDKMPPLEKSKTKPGSGSKRGALSRIDSRDQKRSQLEHTHERQFAELLRQCGLLLKRLMGHRHGWVFNEPVDPIKLRLPDYFMVIPKPMDLGTVKENLNRNAFSTPVEFAEDVRLTFSNAMTYNPPTHEVHVMADSLRKLFEEKWRVIEEKYEEERRIAEADDMRRIQGDVEESDQRCPRPMNVLTPSIPEKLQREEASDQSQVVPKKMVEARKKPSVTSSKCKSQPRPRKEMTFQEKKKLSNNLQLLPTEKLEHIVQLMRERNPSLNQKGDEIEVDIDTFDQETLWELHRYVISSMKNTGKKKKVGQTATAARNQIHAGGLDGADCNDGKGEIGDEDVDIDDDLPDTSFPPVVIEKDGGYVSRSSSSSSGSSSSDSGSSSDSESGSSSGSDTDADDVQLIDRHR